MALVMDTEIETDGYDQDEFEEDEELYSAVAVYKAISENNSLDEKYQEVLRRLRDEVKDSVFERLPISQDLKKNGYISAEKFYGKSPDSVRKKLWGLICRSPLVVEERILMQEYDMESERETVFLANPVLMAIVLEEYSLAEALIKTGYAVDDRCLEPQIYMIKRGEALEKQYEWHDISITQFLFARPEMPETLRLLICERLSLLRPVFDYHYDWWNNPFLEKEMTEKNNVKYMVRKFPVDGFEAICQTDYELLEGMFTEENINYFSSDEMCDYKSEQQEEIFDRLLTYMTGTEDVRILIKKLVEVSMLPHANDEEHEIGRIWWKLFPKIKQICEYDEECTDICVEALMGYYCLYATENRRLGSLLWDCTETHKKKQLQRLEKAIKDLCTADYTQEKFMDYLSAGMLLEGFNRYWISIDQVIWYLNFWKSVLKRGWRPIRFDKSFVEILDAALAYKAYVGTIAEEEEKEKCIQQSIDLVELLDGVSYDECPIKEFGYEQADFMNKVMQLESEELFMLCVEKNLIPKELLPIAAEAALELGYTKLMPSIIYLQSQKGVY